MTIPRVPSYGTVTVKALADLPARILGGTGIQVNVQGFNYRIDLDIEELQTSPVGAAAGKFTAVWDSVDGTYKKIEFTQLPPPALDWSVITGKPATFPPTLPIPESGVTNLVADLASKVPDDEPHDGHTYGRKNGIWSDVAAGVSITVNWTDIVGKPATFPPAAHSHPESDVTGLVADLAARELIANKAVANGYASLDGTGKVPLAQIPAGAGGITDAPSDGKTYGRNSATWSNVTDGFTAKTGATGASNMPVGTTAQRPANSPGLLRYNSDVAALELNNGLVWASLASAAGFVAQTGPTGAANLPAGTTAQRPTAAVGQMRWNSDLALFEGYNGSAWIPMAGAAGAGLFKVSSGVLASAAANINITMPAGFTAFELLLGGFAPVVTAQYIGVRFSADGTTFLSSNYTWAVNQTNALGANAPSGASSFAQIPLMNAMSNSGGTRYGGRVLFPPALAGGAVPSLIHQGHFYDGTNYNGCVGWGTITSGITGLPLAVQLLATGGNIQAGATWQLNGYK